MLRRVEVRGVELQVWDAGAGPPVLLVHGFPLDHGMWRAQIDVLRRDHRVLAVDLRGFGGSGGATDAQPLTMETLADDCAALLDTLQLHEPITLCGLSMGGYVAWQFWARHAARLSRLILCDTRAAADSPETARGRLQMAERALREGTQFLVDAMAERLVSRDTREQQPELITALRRMMSDARGATVAAALRGMAQRPDMTARLSEVQTPTLVICGESDVISPASEMQAMAEAMPRARFVEVPRAGHMAPLEQPTVVNQAILDFLS